jgi:L-lactate dehydrogenase complex protein LldF
MNFASQFLKDARVMAGDLRHRKIISTALGHYEIARDKRKALFQSWESARQLAAETKWDALNHLDKYLVEFTAKIEARGTKVHWASTAAQARTIILQIVE